MWQSMLPNIKQLYFQSPRVGDRTISCRSSKSLIFLIFQVHKSCKNRCIILPTDTAFFAMEGIFIHGGIMATCWAEILRHDCVATATSLAIFVDLKRMKETRMSFFPFETLGSISYSFMRLACIRVRCYYTRYLILT